LVKEVFGLNNPHQANDKGGGARRSFSEGGSLSLSANIKRFRGTLRYFTELQAKVKAFLEKMSTFSTTEKIVG
jgi:hypothetical protein